jgi:hypothetical protein
MPDPIIQIRLEGLTRPDNLELMKELGEGAVAPASPSPDAETDRHHELLTTAAIISISTAALSTLATWLVKRRGKVRHSDTLEITLPNGTKVRRKIDYVATASAPADATVLAQLKSIVQDNAVDFSENGGSPDGKQLGR